MILDNAVAYHMKDVDAVLIGAEAIAESGGAIAKVRIVTSNLTRLTISPITSKCEFATHIH